KIPGILGMHPDGVKLARPVSGTRRPCSESILPGAQGRENLDVAAQAAAAVLLGSFANRGDSAAQEGVGGPFDFQRGRQADTVRGAPLGYFPYPLGNLRIVRLDGLGEAQ